MCSGNASRCRHTNTCGEVVLVHAMQVLNDAIQQEGLQHNGRAFT